jgi:ubiquinone/menaquinone biosynthesis C-methylase UbiE
LDAGCGTGKLCHYIADNYDPIEVVGVDIFEYFDTLPENTICKSEKFSIIEADCEDIPYPDNYFDAVTSISTFEHFRNPRKVLQEIKRVLKPGEGKSRDNPSRGRLFISFAPLWTSCSGHHLPFDIDNQDEGKRLFSLLPAWGHLYLSERECRKHLQSCGADHTTVEKIIDRIYGYRKTGGEINRLTRTQHLQNFIDCGMKIISFKEYSSFDRLSSTFSEITDKPIEINTKIVERCKEAGYSAGDLATAKIDIVLEKYINLP